MLHFSCLLCPGTMCSLPQMLWACTGVTQHTACLLSPGTLSSLHEWALGPHLAYPGKVEGSSAGFAQAAATLPIHSRFLEGHIQASTRRDGLC